MFTTLKLAGVSAVLAAGVLTAEPPKAQIAAASSKTFQDRVAPDLAPNRAAYASPVRVADASGTESGTNVERSRKADRGAPASDPCAGQTWPHLSTGCIASRDAAAPARAVRTIGLQTSPETATTVVAKTSPVLVAR